MADKLSLQSLRAHALSQTLFEPTTLKRALTRLVFVQADPIRAPARAQDLILRHRVKEYRAGDLERLYPKLGIEEDYLYAYGFLPQDTRQWLYPRRPWPLSALDKKVLESVRSNGATHPRDLEEHFGKSRVVNAWGGHSKATKEALETLHYNGLLRVARRDNGIRLYEPAMPMETPQAVDSRMRELVMIVLNLLSPIPERSLHASLSWIRRRIGCAATTRSLVATMIKQGELERQVIDDEPYIWPTKRKSTDGETAPRVRILAPFDPVVWDRRRFEHLWGWAYRFEAYTPPAKRIRGYYAMPLFWRDQAIGWVNAAMVGDKLDIECGYVEKRPCDKAFKTELAAEIDRFESFLGSA